ncbi:MAG TPA: STAS domain-containing protein [Actinomycetes bacterium]|nr:STAS domain-containing protein [Actinomycetes bacterium]
MDMHIDRSPGHAEITLAGRFDAHEAPTFRETVTPLLAAEGDTVRIDLQQVVFVDSTALAELVRAAEQARAVGGDLVLGRISAPVRVILELTALELAFTIEGGPVAATGS